MNLKRLFRFTDENKPNVRSFRLRNDALKSLNFVAKKVGISANEIINISVETLAKEYMLIEEIKKELESVPIVYLRKTLNHYVITFTIAVGDDSANYVILQDVKNTFVGESNRLPYVINDLNDLFDFGFDDLYQIIDEK